MGRPPSNGGPSFRFNQAEIAEMEAILQAHKTAMPVREVLVSLAEKFSNSEERSGKIEVQMKQVWNWFQNRRYAIRAKAAKSPGKLNITQMTQDDSAMVKGVPQATSTQPHGVSSATVRSLPQAPQHPTGPSAVVRSFQQAPLHPAAFSGRVTDNSQMEYEAKSARDGAWYDVSTFLSHRSLETGDPEVLVRFAGFGAEEDEWVLVRKNVRQRSLPCESSECVAVLPADLILCFQEGKEQALYFDAHVLDAQRRRHDVRGCRCRFLVRYDHDQSEEIVALRKICRRPETDYRLQQLHAVNESLSANHNKNGANNIHTVSTLRVYPPAEVQQKQHKVEPVVSSLSSAQVPQKRQKVDSAIPAPPPDGSQKHFKVEPAMVAVPQNQQRVQPAPTPTPTPPPQPLPLPLPQVPLYPNKVEPVVPCPSAQPSLEPNKLESVVPVQSAQDSAVAIVPTCSEKVPLEMHQVQPAMPAPATELSPSVVAPVVAEPLKESMASGTSAEVPSEFHNVVAEPQKELMVSEVPSELHKVVAEPLKESIVFEVPSELHKVVAEPLKESIVSEVPSELHKVVAEPLKESIVSEVPSELHKVEPTDDVSVVAQMETKIAEPQKEEPVVAGMSVEVPSELPEVQPMLSEVSVAVPPLVAEPHKEELMASGPSVEVPSELHEVQPMLSEVSVAIPPLEPKVAEPHKVEVPSELHEVQPMLSEVSVAVSPLEPKVAEQQKEELMVSKVPSQLHEVQPMMPGPLTEEVSVEPKIAEPQKDPMAPAVSVKLASELHKVQPTQVSTVTPIEANVAEPEKQEPGVSVEVPLELHEVQPDEADTSVLEAIETKPKESVEETETKAEEPANSNSGNVIGQPKLEEVNEHAKDAENGDINEVGNPELQMENVGAGTDTVEMEEG